MPAITVKNIPDPLYNSLKQSAQLNHRSINSEIIACLEKELMHERLSVRDVLSNARKLRAKIKTKAIDVDDIQSAIDMERL